MHRSTLSYFLPAVTENDKFQFEVGLPPAQDTQTMKSLSVVIHSSANYSIVRGQVIQLLVTCKNSTAVHLVSSYTPTEADETAEWLELSMNTTNFTCPSSEECKVFIQVGEASSVDALLPLLVVYRYSIDGGYEDSVSSTVQKRAADNITSLSELRGNPCNCSLHSTFLLYATELRIFTETQQVIAPNRNGVDFTYCYGECNRLSAPKSLTIAERVNFLRQGNANIPRPSCVPDQIVDDELLIHSLDDKIVQLQTFPRITSCKCVI